MGRTPCCDKERVRKGKWTSEEDEILIKYVKLHGEGSWRSLPKNAGLLRCGKSCRLRWMNYLKEDVKRGNISEEEERIIVKLHQSIGNRWSLIAGHLPGRTDNEIKNYWNSHLSKKVKSDLQEPPSAAADTDASPPAHSGSMVVDPDRDPAEGVTVDGPTVVLSSPHQEPLGGSSVGVMGSESDKPVSGLTGSSPAGGGGGSSPAGEVEEWFDWDFEALGVNLWDETAMRDDDDGLWALQWTGKKPGDGDAGDGGVLSDERRFCDWLLAADAT